MNSVFFCSQQIKSNIKRIKKRKTGIFASFTSLQNKKERTSAHREASDIQSTQVNRIPIMIISK